MTLPDEFKKIAHELRTQDNRITNCPMFEVQEKVRDWGYHADYADGHVYIDEEGCEYEKRQPGTRKVYYKDRWAKLRVFFTEAAADLYIRQMSHRHTGELRTYVEAYYRCHEMMLIRDWLMNCDKENTTNED